MDSVLIWMDGKQFLSISIETFSLPCIPGKFISLSQTYVLPVKSMTEWNEERRPMYE